MSITARGRYWARPGSALEQLKTCTPLASPVLLPVTIHSPSPSHDPEVISQEAREGENAEMSWGPLGCLRRGHPASVRLCFLRFLCTSRKPHPTGGHRERTTTPTPTRGMGLGQVAQNPWGPLPPPALPRWPWLPALPRSNGRGHRLPHHPGGRWCPRGRGTGAALRNPLSVRSDSPSPASWRVGHSQLPPAQDAPKPLLCLRPPLGTPHFLSATPPAPTPGSESPEPWGEPEMPRQGVWGPWGTYRRLRSWLPYPRPRLSSPESLAALRRAGGSWQFPGL